MTTKTRKKYAKEIHPTTNATPSSSPPEARKRVARSRVGMAFLRLQIASLIGLARKYKTSFNERGWPPQMTDQLQAALDAFDRESIELGVARAAMVAATKEAYTASEEAMPLRTQVTAALKLVLQGDATAMSRIVALNRGGTKPTAMATWFNAVQPMMQGVHPELKKHFPTDPIELVAAEEDRLMKALAKMGTLRRDGTSISAARDATRTELVNGIDQLKLVGTIAFAGNKQVLRGFNKELGMRHPKPAASATGTQTPEPAPSPAPATEAPAAVKPAAAAKS